MLKIYCSEYILVDSKSITAWGGPAKSVKMVATGERAPQVYPVLCLGHSEGSQEGTRWPQRRDSSSSQLLTCTPVSLCFNSEYSCTHVSWNNQVLFYLEEWIAKTRKNKMMSLPFDLVMPMLSIWENLRTLYEKILIRELIST